MFAEEISSDHLSPACMAGCTSIFERVIMRGGMNVCFCTYNYFYHIMVITYKHLQPMSVDVFAK